MKVVIGIDLGTQGVRVLAVDPQGHFLASADEKFPKESVTRQAELHEQTPLTWWDCTARCLSQVTQRLPQSASIDGVAVDSTSGSLVTVDPFGTPLYPAIMYNDARSAPYVNEVRRTAQGLEQKLGYTFNASFALPKILWMLREQAGLAAEMPRFISETDFIVGRLSGSYDQSDFSNMLKFGYDPAEMNWPSFLETELGIRPDALPNVQAPGRQIAQVSAEASQATGLPEGTSIMSGATDGTAAQISSGAVHIGAWNSALGTTLVLKGITKELLLDQQGRIYCHRHPEAGWMPGGASNTGAGWILDDYPTTDPEYLDQEATMRVPTGIVRYPLVQQGERFPFASDNARGFILGAPKDEFEKYAAGLEGVACLERLAYDMLAEIGAQISDVIYITEGGSRSSLWSEIRASMLDKILLRPKLGQASMGAAILAACGVWFNSLQEAAQAMVQIEREFHPNPAWVEPYQAKYHQFVSELFWRGYLKHP